MIYYEIDIDDTNIVTVQQKSNAAELTILKQLFDPVGETMSDP